MARIRNTRGKYIKADLLGQRFTRLLVLEESDPLIRDTGNRVINWSCLCDCGNKIIATTSNLLSNGIKSCGCLKKELIVEKNKLRGFAISGRRGSKDISATLFSRIKTGAKKRNYSFEISIDYLQDLLELQNFKCKLSGIKLEMGYGKLQNITASLDRIDSSKGYIKGNVQWVHKDINWMKQDYSQQEFIQYCKLVAGNNDEKNNSVNFK